MSVYGELFFGCKWHIPNDKLSEFGDPEELCDKMLDIPNMHLTTHSSEGWTFWFGLPVTTLMDHEAKFNEMAIMQMMEKDKQGNLRGALDPKLREEVKLMMEALDMEDRDRFSTPGFWIAWGS
jgi:hypothetical protein